MRTVLACPVCGAALVLDAAAATCVNKHGFDRARNGYLNLLLSNKKQSAEPGDSLAMLQSRRSFLRGGYYDPMAGALIATLTEVLPPAAHIADLGCGDGFFTRRISAALAAISPRPVVYGVDISRPGIKMAASPAEHSGTSTKDIYWIVASLHRSPFLPASLAVALSVFAPIDAADIRRVIRDDGVLITVTPGPDHLGALRALIYSSVKPHPETPALMAGDTLFTHASSTRVRYPMALESQSEISHLLAMTPYYWHVGPAARAVIEALPRLELTVDAYVNVFRPKSGS
jgi:23S rRNA (guanine745-N1)-methyltransferase